MTGDGFLSPPTADCERLRLIFAANQFPEELRAMIKFLNMIIGGHVLE